ncbi:hypothetical protein HU200_051645 [Digitaria exilis]|uniref:F-box domain-containing protein n=1 Tax=Digitaria exilis TaxID=1010633 RepID=A0A835ARN2_9POAL|nr:hypothetical protein HU200_051645 [Digitaria exilis]
MASLLKKFVDPNQWEAEDIVGRLGMLLHAAFLFAGFQPYGACPPSEHLLKQSDKAGRWLCLSRRYTAPELTRRKRADGVALTYVALLIFLIANGDMENIYNEILDVAAISPRLSRSFEAAEPWGSRVCRTLGNRVCWGLLDELCRKNGLPLTSFMSLPDDLKIAILKRLTDGKDLARVECVSAQLRLLVAERHGELWKTLCWWRWSHVPVVEVRSWKDMYMASRRRSYVPSISTHIRCWDLISASRSFLESAKDQEQQQEHQKEQCTVATRAERKGSHRRQVVARNDDYIKRRHGVGAIHSPSSRYRWNHR